MRCPYCSGSEDKVIDSRPSDDNTAIRRRRECLTCRGRFTTYEKLEEIPLVVIKSDGSRQAFDHKKLFQSIMKSCAKRPVTSEQIEALIIAIEQSASNQLRREISSKEIGDQVLERLRAVDEVAYVRFASVYRDFEDTATFLRELHKLIQSEPTKL